MKLLYYEEARQDAHDCGIGAAPPVLSILDVGTGSGYFPHICRKLGHDCAAMDKPRSGAFPQIGEKMGNDALVHRILPLKPFPRLPSRFGLVTILRVPFNVVRKEERLFTLEEWKFFLDDVRDNLLKPVGTLALKLRLELPSPGLQFGSPELMDLFAERGAEIRTRGLIFFQTLH